MNTLKPKKLVFLVGNLEDNLHASNKIMITLAEKLNDLDVECHVYGFSRLTAKSDFGNNGIFIHQIVLAPSFEKSHLHMRDYLHAHLGIINKALYLLLHPIRSFKVFFQFKFAKNFQNYIYNTYAKKAFSFCKTQNITNALVMGSEFAHCKAVYHIWNDDNIKLYFYQLDPWGLNEMYHVSQREGLIAKELAVFSKSEHIFTTSVLLEQYGAIPDYVNYIFKMTVVEFPNVEPKRVNINTNLCFDSNYVNIIYCGILDDGYRSCTSIVAKLLEIPCQKKLRFYFWGDIGAPTLLQLQEKYPQQIFIYDKIPLSQAYNKMLSADVLLNLGNTLTNQVPSKIFDYVSFCKPVLHVQKIAHCPASPYIRRYGSMAYTINELDINWSVQNAIAFLQTASNKTISFAEVEKLYHDCTPTYVAQKVYHQIWRD